MKKYWKLITLTIIIMAGIGTFYIYDSLAADAYPAFTIETNSGNEEVIENLLINAHYGTGQNIQPVQITKDEAIYANERSFFERLDGAYLSPERKHLQENYRNFMRGKAIYGSFYEDEEYLVYANVNIDTSALEARSSSIEVSMLDKGTDETTSFVYDIPHSSEVNHVALQDVQLVNDNVTLITQNHSRSQGNLAIHVYEFDAQSHELIREESIISDQAQEQNQFTDMFMLNETDPMSSKDYAVFRNVVREEIRNNDGTYSHEEISNELIAYNLESGKIEDITLTEELKEFGRVNLFDGTNLYFTKSIENGLEVVSYNIKDKKIENEMTVELDQVESSQAPSFPMVNEGGRELAHLTVHDKNLYILSRIGNVEEPADLIVIDLETEETIYEGEISEKGQNRDSDEKYELTITGIEVN
ncbi:hypothetical protein [Oceanobacillus halotolerans]|uniref:hypothetical protein n=1 Tax=Oceanobacillus halotolerans TaxID=2663380 RepID=UPI0013D96B95|nr:hypothetical protein [Oceanobacillus halotolerans]